MDKEMKEDRDDDGLGALSEATFSLFGASILHTPDPCHDVEDKILATKTMDESFEAQFRLIFAKIL